jgi:hypothetical protein
MLGAAAVVPVTGGAVSRSLSLSSDFSSLCDTALCAAAWRSQAKYIVQSHETSSVARRVPYVGRDKGDRIVRLSDNFLGPLVNRRVLHPASAAWERDGRCAKPADRRTPRAYGRWLWWRFA